MCMCGYHVHSVPTEARRGRALGPLEQASQRVVICHRGVGKWIWDLCKNSLLTAEPTRSLILVPKKRNQQSHWGIVV